MRRFLGFLLLGVPALLLVAVSVYWWLGEQRLSAGFAAWRANAEAQGWHVSAGPPARSGWPLDARLVLPDVSLTGWAGVMPGGLAWQARRLSLDVGLFALPYTLDVAPQDQVLRLGAARPITIRADKLDLIAALNPRTTSGAAAPPAVDMAGKNIVLTPQGAPEDGGVKIGLMQFHGDLKDAGATLHYTSSLEAIILPAGQNWALGQHLSSISLEGTLSGLAALHPDAPSARTLAAGWQAAGGVLKLARLAVGWGPLGLSLAGQAQLDPTLQPVVAASARIVGYAGTLQALARGGIISSDAAGAASAVLGLLAHSPEGGGPSEVVVPVNLRAGRLSVGGVPVMKLAAPSLN